MIRDDGPGILFLPVKMMKESKGTAAVGQCMPMNKAALLNKASDASVAANKAVTVLTYLHGVKEAQLAIKAIAEKDPSIGIDLIELRSLKPLDVDSIRESLQRTHKLTILDESTLSGGVGATISAIISEQCYYDLDAPIKRLCMDDAPVPYASSMELAVVKRSTDLVDAVFDLVNNK
jgi:pyruvate/2-oxoglutarate/acetoin dehydrogenase E1 component